MLEKPNNVKYTNPIMEDGEILTKVEKEKAISAELKKLKAIFKDIEPDRLKLVDALIKNAAFMAVTLTILQQQINEEGPTENFINGKQEFIRESTALKSYNAIIKNYQSAVKALMDLLPEQEKGKSTEDELLTFLKK